MGRVENFPCVYLLHATPVEGVVVGFKYKEQK